MLKKELDQKNQQIENLMKLLDHEQHLRMVVEQKLLPDSSEKQEEQTYEKEVSGQGNTLSEDDKKWWQFWKKD